VRGDLCYFSFAVIGEVRNAKAGAEPPWHNFMICERCKAEIRKTKPRIVRSAPCSILLGAYYEGAAGVRKALREFTLADLNAFRKNILGEAAGLKRKLEVAEMARQALVDCHVNRVGELPDDVRLDIELEWEKAHAGRPESLRKAG